MIIMTSVVNPLPDHQHPRIFGYADPVCIPNVTKGKAVPGDLVTHAVRSIDSQGNRYETMFGSLQDAVRLARWARPRGLKTTVYDVLLGDNIRF
jgi:hypothetical protein